MLFAVEVTDLMLARYLAPLLSAGIDTLVLGCTHYPLLREAIARTAGPTVTLVDSAENCALAVKALLEKNTLNAPPNASANSMSPSPTPPSASSEPQQRPST